MFLLTRLDVDSSLTQLNTAMAIVGLGLGPSQSLINLIVQSAFPASKIGVATSSTQFFRQVGNTIGIAIFGAVLVSNLSTELPKQLPQLAAAGSWPASGGLTGSAMARWRSVLCILASLLRSPCSHRHLAWCVDHGPRRIVAPPHRTWIRYVQCDQSQREKRGVSVFPVLPAVWP